MEYILRHPANHKQRYLCSWCGASLESQCGCRASDREPKSRLCDNCHGPLPGMVRDENACYSQITNSGPDQDIDPINRVERRYLTIMFCDLVNSTRLSTRLDPEEMLQIIQAYRNLCVAIIEKYGGFAAGHMGDGVMSYFGYPQAHEDDAERAVYAALDLLASIKTGETRLGDGNGNRISIRIGIASGLVVVGNPIGTGAAAQETVIGQAPNLAARLQALAQPDSVIVSSETRNLIQNRFRVKNIGMHPLAGFKKTQMLWQVVDAADMKKRLHTTRHNNRTGLPVRSSEFKHIIRQWKLARRRNGRVVLVCGETGIGKSKLLETLRMYVSRERRNQFIFRCSPIHTNGNSYPGHAQIQASAGLTPWDAAAEKKITGNQVETEPCLIILEDAHWIDPMSLERLNELIPQVRGKPILLAISYRIHFKPPAFWFEQDHVKKISLAPLNRPAAELFIRQVSGNRQIPAHLISRIVAGADGIPFFLEELTRTTLKAQLAGYGDLQSTPGDFEIPKKVRTVLMARLDQDTSSREVAQIGSAIGHEFSYSLLIKIWDHNRNTLDHALNSLCRSELLVKTGDTDNTRYTFNWVLMREVAYQSMLKRVRQNLHRRIIRVLKEHFAEQVRLHPHLLERHYTLAGTPKNH